jgi:hypothetical protein
MRRILSILMLLVLGLGPVVPVSAMATGLTPTVASGWTGKVDESRLPACCRRNGKHHCAMSGGITTADASGITTIGAADSCPFAPTMVAVSVVSFAALLSGGPNTSAAVCLLSVMLVVTMIGLFSYRRHWPQRGPPVPLSV